MTKAMDVLHLWCCKHPYSSTNEHSHVDIICSATKLADQPQKCSCFKEEILSSDRFYSTTYNMWTVIHRATGPIASHSPLLYIYPQPKRVVGRTASPLTAYPATEGSWGALLGPC